MTYRIQGAATGLLLALALLHPVAAAGQEEGTRRCDGDPRYAAAAFWVGEWSMVNDEGIEIAVKSVRRTAGGCLIEERWSTGDGLAGIGFTYLDPASGRWRQHRIDGRGVVAHLEGTAESGRIELSGESVDHDGARSALRLTLTSHSDGGLEQVTEKSGDGDDHWKTSRARYLPLRDGAPVTRADVASAPNDGEAAEPDSVRVLSRTARRSELAASDRRQVPLTSPMVLEVELGALHLFPEGASWVTDETAEYLCDRVTVRQVGVAHRSRRGRVELELSATLHTAGRARRPDLSFELLDASGAVVGSTTIEKFRLGGQVPSYNAKTGLTRSALIELEPALFETLFEGDERPRLRVTVTVPGG